MGATIFEGVAPLQKRGVGAALFFLKSMISSLVFVGFIVKLLSERHAVRIRTSFL